jgi:hypothetical protein
MQAVVVLTGLTKTAVAAGPGRRNRDTLTGLPSADTGTQALDHTGDFVTQSHGLADTHRPEPTVLVVMQVRAADTTEGHPHPQLAFARIRHRGVFDAQVSRGMTDDRSHKGLGSESSTPALSMMRKDLKDKHTPDGLRCLVAKVS